MVGDNENVTGGDVGKNVPNNDKGKNVANSISVMIPNSSTHGEKPEKFNGTDYKRWQQKMLFYLTTLNLRWQQT